jgi:hypothetical protein
MLTVLQTIANHIAANMRNFRLLEIAQARVQEEAALFQSSHLIAEASTEKEVLSAASQSVSASLTPTLFLVVEGNLMSKSCQ